ncbi:MAG: tRNA uridine(34) 5-carboxymethylaminomethyl modification radical SAM/GNAT enzyme Elp3 [Olegusella sp.]|nr:tRNA uridine(34) 5-carboxymethylaminomethyl modification radical SAM/GNAT enzyme Elp3 [Olegusella sp.]
MEEILLEIVARIRRGETPDARQLARIILNANKGISDNADHYAKRQLLPYYRAVKKDDPARWASWGIDPATEAELVRLLQLKPRRTASGVATISVLTKPWACGGACLYCPNDVRMPKSYIWDEPACQRAEHSFFDPYLQVAVRLHVLAEMGHPTDKVELIVLGGTWDDYPREYRIWFVEQLFRALNDGEASWGRVQEIRDAYHDAGLADEPAELRACTAATQARIDAGELAYNQAIAELYRNDPGWQRVSARQTSTLDSLREQHRVNERANHRVVGLVVETRPDAVTPGSLSFTRELGCTKVQIGVQGIRQDLLDRNDRGLTVGRIADAFALARLYGFKIHAHFMVNLVDATPETDREDYRSFATGPAFAPDEVKLYPCALVAGTGLMRLATSGAWTPYTRDELVDVLVDDIMATPAWTRVSRMIRDIPSTDIVAGNKQTNLRQMVEQAIDCRGLRPQVREIRMREIQGEDVRLDDLVLQDVPYKTDVTQEHFIQWVTPEGGIAGFLRLSLPDQAYVRDHAADLRIREGEAMIREVHVYGRTAHLGAGDGNAQHRGLGRRLVGEACRIAREAGYTRINVISSVGTREYYRGLGFADNGLYQRRDLD